MKFSLKTIVLTFGAFILIPIPVSAFSDIENTDPLSIILLDLDRQGIINKFKDGSFQPNAIVTRAEAIKLILLSAHINTNQYSPEPIFIDVQESAWYFPYVQTAAQQNIIATDSETFQPNLPINRAEFLKLLITSHNIPLTNSEKNFPDLDQNSWYYQYIITAEALGLIISDLESNIAPQEALKRKQMAELVYNTLVINREKNPQQLIYLAEGNLAKTLLAITQGNLSEAFFHSSKAIFYAQNAKEQSKNAPLAVGTEKIAESYQMVVLALHAFRLGNLDEMREHLNNSGRLASEAVNLHPALSAFSRNIWQLGQALTERTQ